MIIGVTGRIASGKNEVSQILQENGFSVIDVDLIGHEILQDPAVVSKLVTIFGNKIVAGDVISRKRLAQIVFSDRDLLGKLNDVVHPLIFKRISQIIRNTPYPLVVNAAVLFEIGLDTLVDEVWAVDANDLVVFMRLIDRGYSEDEAKKRMSSQMPRDEYIQRADRVIPNNGTLEELQDQVEQAYQEAIPH